MTFEIATTIARDFNDRHNLDLYGVEVYALAKALCILTDEARKCFLQYFLVEYLEREGDFNMALFQARLNIWDCVKEY